MHTVEFIKDVAIAFNIKCNKYVNISPALRDLLFQEAYNEISTIYILKRVSNLEVVTQGEFIE